jgi:serine protease Do
MFFRIGRRCWPGFACAVAMACALPVAAQNVSTVVVSVDPLLRGAVGQRYATRTPGYLGIEFHDLSDDQVAAMHLQSTHPVEIVMVDHDGPAGKAGLRPHDIIVALNGQIVNGAEVLRHMIHEAGAGTQIALQVFRSGKSVNLTAQLADRDAVERDAMQRWLAAAAPDTGPSGVAASGGDVTPESAPEEHAAAPSHSTHGQSFIGSVLHSGPFTGLSMQEMEPQLASYFGAPKGMGLLVQAVATGSPAEIAGLHAGDVVLRADGFALHSTSDWTKRVHASKGKSIGLTVLREKRELTVSLTPDAKKHSMVEWPSFFGGPPTIPD